MAIKITDDCINCGACEPECPNTAIYEASYDWKYSHGTSLMGNVKLPSGQPVNADQDQEPAFRRYHDGNFFGIDACNCVTIQAVYSPLKQVLLPGE